MLLMLLGVLRLQLSTKRSQRREMMKVYYHYHPDMRIKPLPKKYRLAGAGLMLLLVATVLLSFTLGYLVAIGAAMTLGMFLVPRLLWWLSTTDMLVHLVEEDLRHTGEEAEMLACLVGPREAATLKVLAKDFSGTGRELVIAARELS